MVKTDATLLIFQQGVNCAQSKKICSKFIKTNPEGDIKQLADQLTGLQITKQPTPGKLTCINCGEVGHISTNCWGKCPTCDQFGHRPNSCSLTRQEKRRIERSRKQKFKVVLKERNIRNRADETNFNLELPDGYDDSEDNHWTASLNDGRDTVA